MHIWEIEEGKQSMMEKFVCPAHGFLNIMSLSVNFWFQVLFVSQNVPVPFGDGLLLTNPNFLSHLEWDKKKSSITIQITVECKKWILLIRYTNNVIWSIYWLCSIRHTCWISLKSWLTSIIPPSNSLMASAKASIVSMSKWLVGSSRNSMWGFCHASQAKHTRHFWPSDKFLMGLTCVGGIWQIKQKKISTAFKRM